MDCSSLLWFHSSDVVSTFYQKSSLFRMAFFVNTHRAENVIQRLIDRATNRSTFVQSKSRHI